MRFLSIVFSLAAAAFMCTDVRGPRTSGASAGKRMDVPARALVTRRE